MNLTEFCAALDAQLALTDPERRPAEVARILHDAFKVEADEIAIFTFDPELELLRFAWPPHLRPSGAIPLAAKNSLVSRTARNRRGYLDNQFHKTAHTFIFEGVAASRAAFKPQPIQKILSVPVIHQATLKGVIQISRKGAGPQDAGPDFRPAELDVLQQLVEIIACHL